MTWFYVDDGLAFHRKVVAAGNAAMGLWLRAGALSAQQLDDGVVLIATARSLGTRGEIAALLRVGLWHATGHDCDRCTDPGPYAYIYHDYADVQPLRDEVLDKRAKRAAAGAKGGRKSGQSRASRREASASVDAQASTEASASANGKQKRTPSRPLPEVQNPPTTSSSSPPARGCRLPENFEPDADLIEWVRGNAPDVPRAEHAKFVDYWRGVPGARGRKLDWRATWRNWMRRAQEDIAAGRRAPAAGRRSTTDERVAQAAALMDVARELDERDAQHAPVIDITDHRAIGG